MERGTVRIGTAGWSIPRAVAAAFPGEGTHLQRYARVLPCAEINSSFHRPHAPAVYARWAASTPGQFRFAVKVPRTITHDQKLRRAREPLQRFLDESAALGPRRGPLLVQLPPSFEFDPRIAGRFFHLLRRRYSGFVACEPRHASWFTLPAEQLLDSHAIGRVAADPARAAGADEPGGWPGIAYYRLHGSPRIYYSDYDETVLAGMRQRLERHRAAGVPAWCIFDNTTLGAGTGNALSMIERLTNGGART